MHGARSARFCWWGLFVLFCMIDCFWVFRYNYKILENRTRLNLEALSVPEAFVRAFESWWSFPEHPIFLFCWLHHSWNQRETFDLSVRIKVFHRFVAAERSRRSGGFVHILINKIYKLVDIDWLIDWLIDTTGRYVEREIYVWWLLERDQWYIV